MNIYEASARVSALKPGETLELLEYEVNGTLDDIMENVVGSAYSIIITEIPWKRAVQFKRLLKPLDGDLRTFVSKDRRHLFERRPDGFWQRKQSC